MKKILALTLALVLAFSFVACGKKPASSTAASAPAASVSEPADSEVVDSEVVDSEVAESDVAEGGITLDYDSIASWVDNGYIGFTEAEEVILLCSDAANENAILLFADPNTNSAASFIGAIAYNEDGTATISDDVNGLTFTFGVEDNGDGTWMVDMGEDFGMAIVAEDTQESLLESIATIIDSYTIVA